MSKYFFQKINNSLGLSSMQKTSAENTLNSKDLYFLDEEKCSVEKFKKDFVKIATVELKDGITHIDMYIEKSSQKRAILMREKDKEFFIVSSRWLDVL